MNPESLSAPFTFKLQTAPVSSEHCIHVVRTCGTDSSPLVELQVPWRDDDYDDDGSVEKMMKLKTSLHQSLKLCRVKSRVFFVCVCVCMETLCVKVSQFRKRLTDFLQPHSMSFMFYYVVVMILFFYLWQLFYSTTLSCIEN